MCSESEELASLNNFLPINYEQLLKEWERTHLKMNQLKTANSRFLECRAAAGISTSV